MKKMLKKIFVLFVILLSFVGCQNLYEPSAAVSDGIGYFSVTIDNLNPARTILPPDFTSADFLEYKLEFSITGNPVPLVTEYRTNSNISTPVSLNAGTYNLLVTAYKDTSRAKPAAQGSVLGIVITGGQNTPASVTLNAIIDAGQGTFSWNISYPTGVTTATMSIIRLSGSTETPVTPAVTLSSGVQGSRSLDSGYYRVELYLRDNKGQTAELKEILHIYQNMTSTFTHTFNQTHFHFLKVKKVTFSGPTATVYLDGLTSSNRIYLVKVNTSASSVAAGSTGSVLTDIVPNLSLDNGTRTSPDTPEEQRELLDDLPGMMIFDSPPNRDQLLPIQQEYALGETKSFNIIMRGKGGGVITDFASRSFRIIYSSQKSNIWVLNEACSEGETVLSYSDAKIMGDKFDAIYTAETNILGYENGGGPSGNGGLDGQLKIQILVYDINSTADGYGTIGFFSGNDFGTIAGVTNRAEVFYINTSSFLVNRDNTLLTLAHEFQHLIHYSQKRLIQNVPQATLDANTWYNEMMSMMTEDVMTQYLGLSDSKLKTRIGDFLGNYYNDSMTDWTSSSYGNKWAFGSFLLRNYGGAQLLAEMMKNNQVGIPSLEQALGKLYQGLTFKDVLLRYGEFMLLNDNSVDTGIVTLNKTVSNTINGFTYNIPGYDIWSIRRIEGSTILTSTGPFITTLTPSTLRGYSVLLHSDNSWTGINGSRSITLQKPSSSDIELFLIVR